MTNNPTTPPAANNTLTIRLVKETNNGFNTYTNTKIGIIKAAHLTTLDAAALVFIREHLESIQKRSNGLIKGEVYQHNTQIAVVYSDGDVFIPN